MTTGPRTVLLVDDDPAIRRLVGAVLRRDGYEVLLACDGVQALGIVERQCPDFIITDWDMPRMDGIELCRMLRAATLSHYVYLLMLTAKTSTESMISGLQAGADEYLRKPVNEGELLARMQAGQRILDLERKLSKLARSDALTGIPTRRTFQEQFQKEFDRSIRYRLPLTCVMLDVDYFKKVNDTHGHLFGDVVLKNFAQLLVDHCRSSDLVCRHGGEEFCVLLPETDEEGGLVWARRVRDALRAMTFTVGDSTFSITASMGLAERRDDAACPDDILNEADQAMLVAKQSGRDRAVDFRSISDVCSHGLDGLGHQLHPLDGVQARAVMASPVICLRADATLMQAAEFFCRYRISSAAVVNEDGRLAGVLSEKDLLAQMLEPDAWSRGVRQVMKSSVVCYEESTPVRKVYDFLCRVTIRRVIIVRDGRPCGIIGRTDLLRWFQDLTLAAGSASSLDANVERGATGRRQLRETVAALVATARHMEEGLERESDYVVPCIVDGTSRMQELLTDVLAQSKFEGQVALPSVMSQGVC